MTDRRPDLRGGRGAHPITEADVRRRAGDGPAAEADATAALMLAMRDEGVVRLRAEADALRAALEGVAFTTDHDGDHHALGEGPRPGRGTSGCPQCMAVRALRPCEAHPDGCPQDVLAGSVARIRAEAAAAKAAQA